MSRTYNVHGDDNEKLYQSGTLSGINFADYIKSLVSTSFYSYTTNFEDINVNIDADEVYWILIPLYPVDLLVNS